MTHARTTAPLPRATGKAQAIAELSDEFLSADPDRREAIGEEVQGIIDGNVLPWRKSE